MTRMALGQSRPIQLIAIGKARAATLIFLLCFGLYSAANWPALRQAWWYHDDYGLSEIMNVPSRSWNEGAAVVGRPLQFLAMLTFRLDVGPDQGMANQAIRFWQVSLHALAATVIALVLMRATNRRWTALAALPFLLWPFNGEAVLWQSAAGYTESVILSVLGIWLLTRSGEHAGRGLAAGGFLVMLSVLAHQAPSFAALVVWVLLLEVRVLNERPLPVRRTVREAAFLLPAYLIGAVISYAVGKYLSPVGAPRMELAFSPLDKLQELGFMLGHVFLWPGFYPHWLQGAHIALLVLSGAALLYALAIGRITRGRLVIAGVLLAAAAVTPYAANMVVAVNWPSFRVMYLGPLLFAALWLPVDHAGAWSRTMRMAGVVVLAVILTGYTIMAVSNSADYVKSFEADRRLLQQIEDFTQKETPGSHTLALAFVPPAEINNWNPYNVAYMHADSKLPAYYSTWGAPGFVRWFSSLQLSRDAATNNECLASCRALPADTLSFEYFKLPASGVTCLCPPINVK